MNRRKKCKAKVLSISKSFRIHMHMRQKDQTLFFVVVVFLRSRYRTHTHTRCLSHLACITMKLSQCVVGSTARCVCAVQHDARSCATTTIAPIVVYKVCKTESKSCGKIPGKTRRPNPTSAAISIEILITVIIIRRSLQRQRYGQNDEKQILQTCVCPPHCVCECVCARWCNLNFKHIAVMWCSGCIGCASCTRMPSSNRIVCLVEWKVSISCQSNAIVLFDFLCECFSSVWLWSKEKYKHLLYYTTSYLVIWLLSFLS